MSYPLPEETTVAQAMPVFPASDQHLPMQNTSNHLEKKQEFNILEKLKQLRDNKKYCDIVLHVRGTKLEAHKNILAAWSPYFAAKLYPGDNRVFKDSVTVDYDNAEVFSDLLDFMYNGYVAPRETNFLQLLHLAVSFEMEMLKNYCEEFLRCNLHLGNFVSTYFLSRKYGLSSLEEYIVGFLQLNLSDAVKQGEFLSMTAGKFNTFLMKGWMEQIKPEIKLFLIISWVGYDVQEREKYLVLLLGHIDWSSVANDFLLEISRTENFFTSHESSLYLLLQTLFSAGIALGPYTDSFPNLRQTHSHILNEVVTTSLLQMENETYYQVTIKVNSRPTYRDASINTDVNCKHFEEHEHTEKAELLEEVEEEDTTMDEDTMDNGGGHGPHADTDTRELDEFGKFIRNEIEEIRLKEANDALLADDIKMSVTNKRKTNEIGDAITVETLATARDPSARVKGRQRSMGALSPRSEIGDSRRKSRSDGKKTKAGRVSRSAAKRIQHYSSENVELSGLTEDEQPETVAMNTESDAVSHNTHFKSNGVQTPNTLKRLRSCVTKSRAKLAEENSLSDNEDNDSSRFTNLKEAKSTKKTKTQIKSENPLACSYTDCLYTTRLKGRLEKHIRMVHESTLDLRCYMCNFEAKEVRKFNNHMRNHMKGPPFCCDEPRCNYKSEKIGTLLVHRLSHTNERPFLCDICKMSFRSNNTLIAHKKTHTGKKDFECDVCHIRYATKNTMVQHMVTHSNHRPYLCDLCGFATKFQSHLISHRRIHSGEVFYCQFPKCKYSTPKRSQLKSHMRAHLGIRSHFCTTCGKSFIERSHLYRHEKLHTDEKLQCGRDQCDYMTTRKDKLKEHILKHHGEGAEPIVRKSRCRIKENKDLNTTPDETVPTGADAKSQMQITPPMLVKWDHGGYSMQQASSQGNNYCVLRDQLTTGEQVAPVMGLIPDSQLTTETRLTDISANVPSSEVEHHAGLSTADQHITLTSAHNTMIGLVGGGGQLDQVGSPVVSSSLDGGMASTHAASYTLIPNANTVVQQQPQPEYGGLSAFMALF